MIGNKTDNGVHEVGTDDIRLTYQHDTPGQDVENYIKEQEKAFHEEKDRTKKHFSQIFGNPLQGYPHNEAFEVKEIKENQEVFENEEGLKNKAEKSGISLGILKQVYNRGLAAYKTGHRPGATAPQWAMARVNSFITKGKGTWGKADSDLADKVRGSKK